MPDPSFPNFIPAPGGSGSVHLTNAEGLLRLLPDSLSLRGFERPRRVVSEELRGRHGLIVTQQRSYGSKRGSIEGLIEAASEVAAVAQIDELLAFLDSAPLKLRLDGATGRYLLIETDGFNDSFDRSEALRRISIPVRALDPLWYADAETADNQPSLAASPHAWALGNDGNAPTSPLFTFTATGVANFADPKISHGGNGNFVQVITNMVAGDVLVINTERLSVTKNTLSVLASVDDGFLLSGFPLAPGLNPLEFTATGTVDLSIQTTLRARWL